MNIKIYLFATTKYLRSCMEVFKGNRFDFGGTFMKKLNKKKYMSCQVNVNDGRLNETATAEHGGGLFSQHPDSGFVFSGERVDNWKQIKTSVISYA